MGRNGGMPIGVVNHNKLFSIFIVMWFNLTILIIIIFALLTTIYYSPESFDTNTYWNSVKDQYKGATGPRGPPGDNYDNYIPDDKKAIIDGFINDLHLNKNGSYYINNIRLSRNSIPQGSDSLSLKFHDFSSDETLNKLELFLSQLEKKDGVYYINNNPIKCK